MTRRLSAALAGMLTSAAALAACGDPTSIEASNVTVRDTLVVYALTGTPISVPTAIDLASHSAVRADASASFDVAFDVDDAGKAVLIPVQLVTPGLGTTGVQKQTQAFDAIRRAPDGTYVEDSTTVLGRGDVVVIRAHPPACASSFKGPPLYAKMVIDSVNSGTRTVHFRVHVDPNCGFRDLGEGLPNS